MKKEKNSIMTPEQIVWMYNNVVSVMDKNAEEQSDRAYGGFVRATKGNLVEIFADQIIYNAWLKIGGDIDRIKINSNKIHVGINRKYIASIKNNVVRKYIEKNIDGYYYGLSVDRHIFIDNNFALGIECKAYAENAMLKRILVDFHLLKTIYPKIDCFLFQLESQLTGDYSQIDKETIYGSTTTHTLMSYFPDVNLEIITLLQGERKVDQPIHKKDYFKPLNILRVENVIKLFSNELKKFI